MWERGRSAVREYFGIGQCKRPTQICAVLRGRQESGIREQIGSARSMRKQTERFISKSKTRLTFSAAGSGGGTVLTVHDSESFLMLT